jgi:hypothetical protein
VIPSILFESMEALMMGERSGSQSRFFYRFNLEDRVSAEHLLRKIDAVVDLSKLRSQLAPHYSHTGRPSIDPELMMGENFRLGTAGAGLNRIAIISDNRTVY